MCDLAICYFVFVFFFLHATTTTEIYTLSLHDALPISCQVRRSASAMLRVTGPVTSRQSAWRGEATKCRPKRSRSRSEEHTSELQSRLHLVCRLLLEKKKTTNGCGW